MAKLSMTATDRVMVEQLYPKEGDMMTIVMVKDMRGKTSLSAEEMKQIELRGEKGMTMWNAEKSLALVKDIDFSGAEITLLKGQIDKLDKEKKVTESLLDICVKIKEGKSKKKKKGAGDDKGEE